MADLLTSGTPHPATVVTVSTLSSIFDNLGFVPAPSFVSASHSQAEDPDDYLVLHTYHTTFVFGLPRVRC